MVKFDLSMENYDYTTHDSGNFGSEIQARPEWKSTIQIMLEHGIDGLWIQMGPPLDKLRCSKSPVLRVIYHLILDKILHISATLLSCDDMSDDDLRQLVKVRENTTGTKQVYLRSSDGGKVRLGGQSIRAFEHGRRLKNIPASVLNNRLDIYNNRVKRKAESFGSITTLMLYRYTAKPNKFVDDVVEQALERLVNTAENVEKVMYALYTGRSNAQVCLKAFYDLGYLPAEMLFIAQCQQENDDAKQEVRIQNTTIDNVNDGEY